MKTSRRYRHRLLLCLLLMFALWAMSGCQAPPAPEPTSAPSPVPPTATTAPPTQEPTFTALPEPPTATVAPPTQEPTAPPSGPTPTELRTFPRVTVAELQQWMAAGEALFFVDARSVASWDTATTKVPGALRVPPHEDIKPYLDQIPQDRRVVIYCT